MHARLVYGGQVLAVWRFSPRVWMPSFGTPLAVKYKGKLTLFRAIRWDEDGILLDKYER